MITAICLLTTACSSSNSVPGADVGLEKHKLDDLRRAAVTSAARSSDRKPDTTLPVFATANTEASVTEIWKLTPDEAQHRRAVDELARASRARGVRWHRASCTSDAVILAGTSRIPTSEGALHHWAADVLLAETTDPTRTVGDLHAPFLQLTVSVARGQPSQTQAPPIEPTTCPRDVGALLG